MRAVDIIIKKRDGGELSQEEIEYFITHYTAGEIPDYQAAAWAMAVLLRGMTPRETTDLTLAMAHSGEVLDLSSVMPLAVDKHSTGGVGDKTTLVVQPVVAACGLAVGKMSGRGLGFTGGTLDKLESIPGFRADLTTAEFLEQLRKVGLVLSGQSADLAPADGKLYALRDVTGTVQSIPLIASSVMCKKIAAGAQAMVLDVKIGSGAFMDDQEEGKQLAELMVSIAHLAGRRAVALLSDMNQPLGFAVGNALEVKEAIDTLHGDGPQDFTEHCLVVAGHMLAIGGLVGDEAAGMRLAAETLASDRAWERFKALILAQGGDPSYIEKPQQLPMATLVETIAAPRSGYLSGVHARIVGETAMLLGAGREEKGEPIDHAVGVIIHHKVGDWLEAGQPLFTIHANHPGQLAQARQLLLEAHAWSDTPHPPLPLFYGVIH
ncbi:MAG: thymidine phosphorylase [Chloroflexi bacterium RBG_16_58_14]|nr:MAG: thymidine phosphorylase [Chloroflexi bacterium RBG_16_58_14]